ncbi:aminoacyl-tRNA deacylase [Ideonella sp. YS5]|uniref:aminoacyl-tRNA deacylase n=1 Tax=Ideonella sp. YS5 TaxID=3453714 RepID=UPI003EEE7B1D
MSIPLRVTSYLEHHGVRYEVCAHAYSRTSAQTARQAHLPPHLLAKSVLIEDEKGCVLAVLPADRQVRLGQLAKLLGRHDLHLADEARVADVMSGCLRGAVPAVGMAWGLETVVDDELAGNEVVYFEAGDHERLLRMTRDQFAALMRDVRHGRIAGEPTH